MTPKLYVFTISHYCEKAIWALDYLGLDYELVRLSPISHRAKGAELGLERGSVPFLEFDNGVVQGSAEIIAWAEVNRKNQRSLCVDRPDVIALQSNLDSILGVHVRRYYYSEAIVEHASKVKPIFVYGLPFIEKLKMQLAWFKVPELMAKYMDLGEEQGKQSQEIIDSELAALDTRLTETSANLLGQEFTAADIAAASLLAPLVLPTQYPVAELMYMPPKVTETLELWKERPIFKWVEKVYAARRSD